MTFTSLLVPNDYGPHADRALCVAADIAAQADLPVELITVTGPRLDPEDDEPKMLRRADGLRPVPCTVSIVREDDVGAALTRALSDLPDALPVIGYCGGPDAGRDVRSRRLAQAICTWADTFDAAVSVVDVIGEGGLARGEAQFALREVSLALRRGDLPATISVVHADDLADALRDLARRSPAILAISTGHWTTPDRVHREPCS